MMKEEVMELEEFATIYKTMDDFPKKVHDFDELIKISNSP